MSSSQGPPDILRGSNDTARVIREKIWHPVNEENDWRVFVIVGREGSGKSMTCASILEKCDPNFDVDSVHFEPVDFLEHIADQSTSTGDAVMLDEAGVGLGVRSWYEKDQIKVNKALQTARDDNMIVGMTLPRLEELDSQTEGRMHHYIRTWSMVPGEHVRFKFQDWSPTRDGRNKTYRKNVRYNMGGRKVKYNTLAIGMPRSREFVYQYEQKKSEFKEKFYEQVVEEKEEAKAEELTEREVVEQLKDNGIEEIVGIHGGHNKPYFDPDLIAMHCGINRNKAGRVRKLIQQDEELQAEDYA